MRRYALAVGRLLWVQSGLESNAAGSAYRLSRCALLTAEERDAYGDMVLPDEQRHAQWCRKTACGLGGDGEPIPAGIVNAERDDLERLIALLTAERLFLSHAARLIPQMGRAGAEIEAGLRTLEREEIPHVLLSLSVVRRLRRERPDLAVQMNSYRRETLVRSRHYMLPLQAAVMDGGRP